ncbi:MAG: hypothetical protein LC645_01475 [Geobacteraceae bacterium]|nr:hypothetical protein [Geobacteraceae bacterium]
MHNVLVLHSYHAGLTWTDGEMKGIEQQFEQSKVPVRLHVEYMDTKRNPGREYLKHYSELLRYKLRNLHFDLILVTDNDAYNLALEQHEELFSGSPVVFSGVNDFHPDQLAGVDNITGVAEDLSVEETLEVALRLHPDTRELILIGSDLGATDLAINQDIERSLQRYSGKLKLSAWRDIPVEKLQNRVTELQTGQLIFLSSVLTRSDGTVLSFHESITALRRDCPVPIYSFWDFFLGYGLFGGKLISSEAHGREAARLGASPMSHPAFTRLRSWISGSLALPGFYCFS